MLRAKIAYTNRAKMSLSNISRYITGDDPHYAKRVLDSISGSISGLLNMMPYMGRAINENNTTIRRIVEKTYKYRINYYYDEEFHTITILDIGKYKNF